MTIKTLALATLRGPAQVIFRNNALTGALFIGGIVVTASTEGRWEIAAGAIVGLLASTLTGLLLGLPTDEGEAGLWGFNGLLTGTALATFLAPTPLAWGVLILASAMTTWVREGLNKVAAAHRINSLTIPFVLCTWIILAAARLLGGLDEVGLNHPMLPENHYRISAILAPTSIWQGVEWILKGVGQIMLCDSWVAGIFFLAGLAVSSPWAALWALVGSAIGTYGALLYGASPSAIASGLYGFSPALTAVALGCVFYTPSARSAIWAVVGAVATLFLQAASTIFLTPLGLPSLTSPFCVATWFFLLPLLKLSATTTANGENHSSWHRKHP